MSEDDKILHLMKGMAEGAFQLLVKGPLTAATFSAACKAFEEAQRSRLDKSAIKILPNVANYSPSTAIDRPGLRTLIQKVRGEGSACYTQNAAITFLSRGHPANYTLRHKVGFSAVQTNFLFSEVTERSSAAGLVQIR